MRVCVRNAASAAPLWLLAIVAATALTALDWLVTGNEPVRPEVGPDIVEVQVAAGDGAP
ncbi:MAG: hypothetical protein RMK74_11400 [Myxococcales bacterium]|nr:hypothetical protein [Myxococcales bacterium]